MTLNYCDPSESIVSVWNNGGVSRCYIDTLVPCVTIGLTFIAIIQLHSNSRSSRKKYHIPLPKSRLFQLQIGLHVIMPLVAIIKITIQSTVFTDNFFASMIVPTLQGIIVWPVSCFLIIRDCNNSRLTKGLTRKRHKFSLLALWAWMFIANNLMLMNINSPNWFFGLQNFEDIFYFCIYVIKYLIVTLVFIIGCKSPGIFKLEGGTSTSRTRLLQQNGQYTSYTNFDQNNRRESESSQTQPPESLISKMRVMVPFIWPRNSILYQFYAVTCLLLLLAGRVTNTFVPIYSKLIVDSMTPSNNTIISESSEVNSGLGTFQMYFRWDYVLTYVALKIVQGGIGGSGGLLDSINTIMWLKVQQYTSRGLEVHFFEHLHSLSHNWHLTRKTGAVLRSMDRGTESFNNILNYMLFNVLPTIMDVIVAVIYFTTFFGGWFGFIVFLTVLVYLLATFTLTEYRTRMNRARNQVDNELKHICLDSLLNFETIKDYATLDYEKKCFSQAMDRFQKQEFNVQRSMSLNDVVLLIVINAGLLAGSLLCVKAVVDHAGLTIGDYVLFASYLIQLFEPLNNFGKYFKSLQRYFLDLESMIDVLLKEPEVRDAPNAKQINVKNGYIEFKDVSFSYIPGRSILNKLSFCVPPGSTLALVGPSGGGKTSIVRLLLRCYNPSYGSIFIDGQNIQNVTVRSLRKSIGVVPQDTVLFNATIKHNISYGRLGASDEEIIEACKAACIHEKIMTFPHGYNTKVGERGLRLSGGEKQRVAIARILLKNPSMILLDEATSSLDSCTEKQIQSSLQLLCQNRTSIIVAHRLSTIANADRILVIKDGQVEESGRHHELLEQQGLYASMWNEQLKPEEIHLSPDEEESESLIREDSRESSCEEDELFCNIVI